MDISIVDYGAGNVANVKNALNKIGADATISTSPKEWKNASAIILPGVGAFGAAMRNMGKNAEALKSAISSGTPFLGICLGMQLLFESSQENPGIAGLGILRGTVVRFDTLLPVPHMGWNVVTPAGKDSGFFDGIGKFYAYFVHSYYCKPAEGGIVSANTEYGIEFASALAEKNVLAVQFHPEKSGDNGLKLLRNFIKEARK